MNARASRAPRKWGLGLWIVPLAWLLAACIQQVDAPQQVDAAGADTEVALQWDAVGGAQAYNIYWNATGKDSAEDDVVSTQTTSTTITGLRNDSTYYFRVASVSSAGVSATSPQVAARTTAARLQSIRVTPDSSPHWVTGDRMYYSDYIITGTQLYFTATGVYSDGSEQDVSRLAKWQSSDTAVATVRKEGRGAGLVQAKTQGPVIISATFRNMTGAISSFSVANQLREIIVLPHDPQVATGTKLPFQAFGLFSQDIASYGYTVQNLTASVTWGSSNPRTARVSSALSGEGIASALNSGDSVISASFAGQTARSLLQVAPVALQSINLTPANPSIPLGLNQSFLATGVYTDGSTRDITQSLLWESSVPTIASVSNYSNNRVPAGVAQTIGWGPRGATVITARLQDMAASATLTVTDPKVVALSLEPQALSLMPGASAQLSVFQIYDNGARYAAPATYFNFASADSAVATVDANGSVTGAAPGTATRIIATDPARPELSASAVVTIVNAPANHNTIVTGCFDCHDGVNATGKGPRHAATSDQCEACHLSVDWRSLVYPFAHNQTTAACVSCHQKPAGHCATTAGCEACHNVVSFFQATAACPVQ